MIMARGMWSFPSLLGVTLLLSWPSLAQTTWVPVTVPVVSAGSTPANTLVTADVKRAGDQPPVDRAHNDRTMRIGTGDLLQITVFGVPDLAEEVRVNDAGNITMPLIGNVRVAGLTSDEAQQLIAAHLREGGMLRDPQVEVFEKEYASQGIAARHLHVIRGAPIVQRYFGCGWHDWTRRTGDQHHPCERAQ
jgi:hypothetical protein